MKALVYRGPRDVRVEDVPDAKIEKQTDVLVRITSTTICGSDLHMCEGRTSVESGKVLGHENLGVVIEVGSAVDRIKKGDHVALPFNIGCGFCRTCERSFSGFCLTTNPDPETAGAAYGRTWGRTTVARPSTCACRTPTSTACAFRRTTRRRRRTTT